MVRRIDTSKAKLYPTFEKLPKGAKKVLAALYELESDSSCYDSEGKFSPSNEAITAESGVRAVTQQRACLTANGYIDVCYEYVAYEEVRRHYIRILEQENKVS